MRISHKLAIIGLALAGCLLWSRSASAQVCVQIDTARDTLSEQDRASARSLVMQAFEAEGVPVDQSGQQCSDLYYVFNTQMGNTVTATISGPLGTRTARVRTIDDLPYIYSQMVKSLISGRPMSTDGPNVDRTNVTLDQANPRRARADSLWYARLGFGIVKAGDALPTGPSFGVGFRYELDRIGIDASIFNITLVEGSQLDDVGGINGSWARVMAILFTDPIENGSPLIGLGLSWGGTSVKTGGYEYSESGLQAELSAGYEMLRASNIRLWASFDATLPLYISRNGAGEELYTPTFALSIGGGFGRR